MSRVLLKSLLFVILCGVYAFNAAVGVSLFSNYGQIQNVQNYSTNPFWSPGSPYNQRVPQPVYVQGTDLKAEDCLNMVQSAVAVQCMTRDNCKNASLSDIRPSVMIQLSNLPNKNYVSACAGYIDSVFESYVAQYSNSIANGGYASFPDATTPANYSDNTIQVKNTYKVQAPTWLREVNERKNELQQLQVQNGLGAEQLNAVKFPSVYEDLSFAARMELQKEGYEPFKDMDSYIIPNFQNAGQWCNGEGKFTDFCRCRGAEKDSDYCKKFNGNKGSPSGLAGAQGPKEGQKSGSGKKNGDDGKKDKKGNKTKPIVITPQNPKTEPEQPQQEEHEEQQQEDQEEEQQEQPEEEQQQEEQEQQPEEDHVQEDPQEEMDPEVKYVYWIEVLSGTPKTCYQSCNQNVESVNWNNFLNKGIFYPTLDSIFCVDDSFNSGGFIKLIDSGHRYEFSEAQIEKINNKLIEIGTNRNLPNDCNEISLKFYQVNAESKQTVQQHDITIQN